MIDPAPPMEAQHSVNLAGLCISWMSVTQVTINSFLDHLEERVERAKP